MPVAQMKHASQRKSQANYPPEGHICVGHRLRPRAYFCWKEGIERTIAAILLIPGLPLIGLLALLVRLHSRGPGIYRQTRMGKNARVFTMYKIRTMRHDAENGSGPVWAKSHDPRVTRLGRFLRKLHLDELPQLINVVKGEMGLIGPRPERPEIVAVLAAEIPGYTDRLVVLPGVTGLAQINLPPDATVDDVRQKLTLDLQYIERTGTWLDLRIFLSTFVRMLGLPGVCAMHLFRLRWPAPHIGHARAAPLELGKGGVAGTADEHHGGSCAADSAITDHPDLATKKSSDSANPFPEFRHKPR